MYRPNKAPRKMPTERAIRAFWAGKLWSVKGYDSPEEFMEPGNCFACGWHRELHRAHVQARCSGGADDVSNLHMLCRTCHKASELISGDKYYKWLVERQSFDGILSIAVHAPINLSTFMAVKQ